jgi:S-formylglutathione hydrolase FrmB
VVGGSPIGPIGTRAQDYVQWLTGALVPWVDAHYRTEATPAGRTILGWSLGALNAFDVAWQYPELFGRVGAFSPSFWLAASRRDAQAVEHTRLAQFMVAHTARPPRLRMWFAVGTAEETHDRNRNGTIDAVEDVEDLMRGYRGADGFAAAGLAQLGYTLDMDGAAPPAGRADATLRLLPGGHHDQAAWKRMLPPFLRWAYGSGR